MAVTDSDVAKKQIDTIRNISGEVGDGIPAEGHGVGIFLKPSGCFQGALSDYDLMGNLIPNTQIKASARLKFSSSYVVPVSNENRPYSVSGLILISY